MDEYSKKCFEFLKNNHPEYLEEIGFTTEESIISLKEKIIVTEQSKSHKCRNCNSTNTQIHHQQLRSADEGATAILYCNNCQKHYSL